MRSRPPHSALRLTVCVAVALAAWAVAAPALGQGCAMCGTALTDDALGRAFSWSVLFLIAAPYAVAGTIGGWLFYTYRRAATGRRAAVIDLASTGRPPRRRPGQSEGDLS
jgi:hypothetical protein